MAFNMDGEMELPAGREDGEKVSGSVFPDISGSVAERQSNASATEKS